MAGSRWLGPTAPALTAQRFLLLTEHGLGSGDDLLGVHREPAARGEGAPGHGAVREPELSAYPSAIGLCKSLVRRDDFDDCAVSSDAVDEVREACANRENDAAEIPKGRHTFVQ